MRVQQASGATQGPAVTAGGKPEQLGFIAAGERWLLDAGSGVQVIDAAITPVPLTQPWYLGLVAYRQRLLGAIDLGGLRGADVAPLRATERLLVLPERWNAALRVDRVHGLLDAAAIDSANADGMRWQMLDIDHLCQSTDFLHPGLRRLA